MTTKQELDELAKDMAREERIMEALDDTYQQGKMEYMHYSPARDATCARMAALSFSIAALRSHIGDDR